MQIAKVNMLETLPVSKVYLELIPRLEKHHKDPFDHLIVAAANAENMTLITTDESIHKYDANWIW